MQLKITLPNIQGSPTLSNGKMSTAMGPPPLRTTAAATATRQEAEPKAVEEEPSSSTTTIKVPMGPPPLPPRAKNQENSKSDHSNSEQRALDNNNSSSSMSSNNRPPYTIPEWSGTPCHKYYLEVLKDGSIIDQFDICEKGAYMFGRVDLCDFVLEHPTISRYHAVLQFKRNGNAFLYDLGSTHGTFINKSQIDERIYVELRVGDVIRFGQSSRLYIFQGPPDLMPPEVDKKIARDAKIRQMMLDKEASLQRARREASLADGISWGMSEDAVEEIEEDDDEVTWQTYKGQLTEKQEKTREKIIKRTQKIAHMKKEIDAIRAKDIAQGGLTQGQQTQIARNEQRISQLMEELENLEETLNESIRESIGARAGRITRGKKKGTEEEDDETLSDDDEFYDRTKKAPVQNAHENQSVETADSLLDKRDAIMKEMEEKKELLLLEKIKLASKTVDEPENGDSLDAFMFGVSSQLVLDTASQIDKELATLQSELDRTSFLLKIADPSGEAAKKRDSKAHEQKPDNAEASGMALTKPPPVEVKKSTGSEKPIDISSKKLKAADASVFTLKTDTKLEAEEVTIDSSEGKNTVYTEVKPQWLGAVDDKKVEGTQQLEVSKSDESDQFIDYKNRQKINDNSADAELKPESDIENAAPGLIVRKRKGVDSRASEVESSEQPSSIGAELCAEDAVALLLKHKRGYVAEDEEMMYGSKETVEISQSNKDSKKAKKVLGPDKPSFLKTDSDYESWVPPQGQSGDGRTSLNDRYGY